MGHLLIFDYNITSLLGLMMSVKESDSVSSELINDA